MICMMEYDLHSIQIKYKTRITRKTPASVPQAPQALASTLNKEIIISLVYFSNF